MSLYIASNNIIMYPVSKRNIKDYRDSRVSTEANVSATLKNALSRNYIIDGLRVHDNQIDSGEGIINGYYFKITNPITIDDTSYTTNNYIGFNIVISSSTKELISLDSNCFTDTTFTVATDVTETNYTDYYIKTDTYVTPTTFSDEVTYYMENDDGTFTSITGVTKDNYTDYYIKTEAYKVATSYDSSATYYKAEANSVSIDSDSTFLGLEIVSFDETTYNTLLQDRDVTSKLRKQPLASSQTSDEGLLYVVHYLPLAKKTSDGWNNLYVDSTDGSTKNIREFEMPYSIKDVFIYSNNSSYNDHLKNVLDLQTYLEKYFVLDDGVCE